jgi:uncharacterized protein (DUF58 family)
MSTNPPGPVTPPPLSAVSYPMRPQRPVPPVRPPRAALAPLDMAELAALGSLPLRARRLAEAAGAGRHRSRRKGASVEFADYRDYQPGDDLRRVDWRLYGRTDRVQIRDAHEESPLRVQLLLDVSASMSYASRPGLLSKLDVARSVLGALALLIRRQRDACGVGLLADSLLQFLPPSSSPARLRAVWGALESPAMATPTALGVALAQAAEVAPRACLFVIASDFYEQPEAIEAATRRLHFERQDVLALHLVDPAEEDFAFAEPAEFQDLETGAGLQLDPVAAARAYRTAFKAHQAALREMFCACGFDYLVLRTDASPLAALSAYLARRAGKT